MILDLFNYFLQFFIFIFLTLIFFSIIEYIKNQF